MERRKGIFASILVGFVNLLLSVFLVNSCAAKPAEAVGRDQIRENIFGSAILIQYR